MSFIGQFQEGILGYLRKNAALYFFVVLLFVLGVVAGALTTRALDADQKKDLVDHLQVFLRGLGQEESKVDPSLVVQRADSVHLKTAIALWILGITVVGLPVVVGIIFVKGFVIGFSVGFLVEQMGLSGLVFSLFSIWPQNLLAVPAFLVIAASAVSLSWMLFTNRLARRRTAWVQELTSYTLLCLGMTACLMVAGLIEGYVTPVLMRLVGGVLG